MKKVVSFSGGRTSAYLCHLMIEKFGRENVDFVYMDTGAEHPKTYEFIRNVNEHFGLNITCLRTDFSSPLGAGNGFKVVEIDSITPDLKPFSEMMAKYGTPYIGGMFCTDRMKLVPFTKYCNEKYGRGNYETWLGIRADEPKRYLGDKVVKFFNDREEFPVPNEEFAYLFKAMVENQGDPRGEVDIFNGCWPEPSDYDKSRFRNEWQEAVDLIVESYKGKTKNNLHYMVEISDADKSDVLSFWSKMPFDLGIDEWLGNCVFCPKKSNLKLAAAQRDDPAAYIDFLEAVGDIEVRKVVSRTQDFIDRTGFYFYPERFYGRSSQFIKRVLRYNEKRYEMASNLSSIAMYRGKKSLEQVIGMFDGSTGDEIKARIRGTKSTETGSCSESCEVFVCEANQIDMFS